jgi:hypothetical protein
MSLRSAIGQENANLRHAGMEDRLRLELRLSDPELNLNLNLNVDASGEIHVNPDSNTPCWNDDRAVLLENCIQ